MVKCKNGSEKETLKKSSPEFSFYHKVSAFFEGDPDIEVGPIDDYEFTITVYDERKCDILKKVLYVPETADRLTVNIECAEQKHDGVSEKDLAYLLANNKHFSHYYNPGDTVKDKNGLTPKEPMRYVMMRAEVVQYYDDIFNNPNGFDTKTAEQLAKELFHGSHLNITSDVSMW